MTSGNTQVPAFADDLAVERDDCSDRYFGVLVPRMPRQFQRTQHEAVIFRAEFRGHYSHSIVAGGLPLIS
jgi:hypothetical protein